MYCKERFCKLECMIFLDGDSIHSFLSWLENIHNVFDILWKQYLFGCKTYISKNICFSRVWSGLDPVILKRASACPRKLETCTGSEWSMFQCFPSKLGFGNCQLYFPKSLRFQTSRDIFTLISSNDHFTKNIKCSLKYFFCNYYFVAMNVICTVLGRWLKRRAWLTVNYDIDASMTVGVLNCGTREWEWINPLCTECALNPRCVGVQSMQHDLDKSECAGLVSRSVQRNVQDSKSTRHNSNRMNMRWSRRINPCPVGLVPIHNHNDVCHRTRLFVCATVCFGAQ